MRTHGVTHFSPDTCFGCRIKTIQFPAYSGVAFKAHFNHTVGQYVSNDREFRSALSRLSDDNSERTGISHSYEPVSPSDLKSAPPSSTAPSHLQPLARTHDVRYSASVAAERDKARSQAREAAETRDVIHHA